MNDQSENTNPYQTPISEGFINPTDLMPNKQRLSQLVQRRLSGKIHGEFFVEQLWEFDEVKQRTVSYSTFLLENCENLCGGKIDEISKPEWDFVQRVLLLLESNSKIVELSDKNWFWTFRLINLILVSLSLLTLFTFHWSLTFLLLNSLLGGIAFFSSCMEGRQRSPKVNLSPWIQQTRPFASISDLEKAIKQTGFRRKKFPFRRKALKTKETNLLIRTMNFILGCILFLPLSQIYAYLAVLLNGDEFGNVVVSVGDGEVS